MIHPARIQALGNTRGSGGRYLLYWMQASQRTTCNHALEYAVTQANALGLPLLVGFGLMDDYPEANARHYAFLLQGLADIAVDLQQRGIGFTIRRGAPPDVALQLAKDAGLVVCDRGYLRHQKRWRDQVADHAPCPVVQVETDVVVPAEAASDKAEFAARTLRPRITRLLDEYLRPLESQPLGHQWPHRDFPSDVDPANPLAVLPHLRIDHGVSISPFFVGGQRAAQQRLSEFLAAGLTRYDQDRSDPSLQGTSLLAPYLHFGHISPLDIALQVRAASGPSEARDAFLEQLIVRRELAVNFVHYTPNYDEYLSVPSWARRTLASRRKDPRPYVYSRQQLENYQTHDPYWNHAQIQMVHGGFLHNTMRMYWGKKILEWKASPQEAFADALYLNNKYFLCGRDPASYANIGWLFGLHDRPWPERPITGQIRTMNARGLERKYNMHAWLQPSLFGTTDSHR